MDRKTIRGALPLAATLLFTLTLFILFSRSSGWIHNIDPVMVQFRIFGAEIVFRYYGLVYFLGFTAIYTTLAVARAKGTIDLGQDQVEVFVFLGFLGMIAGARFFEVLFYDPGRYISNPLDILKIWEGGLSFHGALVGVAVTAWLYSRKKKIHFLELTDLLTLPASFFLALGRGANFINGELYGTITDLPWGVKFSGADGFRHPTQIYEALKNLYLFSFLYLCKSRKPRRGFLTFLFLIGYGGMRFTIEFLKNYNQYGYTTLETPALNMAQLLCLAMVVTGTAGMIRIFRKRGERSGQP